MTNEEKLKFFKSSYIYIRSTELLSDMDAESMTRKWNDPINVTILYDRNNSRGSEMTFYFCAQKSKFSGSQVLLVRISLGVRCFCASCQCNYVRILLPFILLQKLCRPADGQFGESLASLDFTGVSRSTMLNTLDKGIIRVKQCKPTLVYKNNYN